VRYSIALSCPFIQTLINVLTKMKNDTSDQVFLVLSLVNPKYISLSSKWPYAIRI